MTMEYYCGIDPGIKGAIVVIDALLNVVYYSDIPIIRTKKKSHYDLQAMSKIVDELIYYFPLICIETQQSMPYQSARSTFSCGYGYGIWIGFLACTHLTYFSCAPKVWQKEALRGAAKPEEKKRRAILRCQQIFPEFVLSRSPGGAILDGRSDAAMMAYYTYLITGRKEER